MIAHNPDRLGKKLWTDAGDGEPIDLYAAYNEIDEARFVVERIAPVGARRRQPRRCARSSTAATRSRARSKKRCSAEQMPYRVYGGQRFFERAEIKDTLAYLRLVANRADDAAFERAVNTPTRGIGERTLDEVRRRARADGAVAVGRGARAPAKATCSPRARATRIAGFLALIEALAGRSRRRCRCRRRSTTC